MSYALLIPATPWPRDFTLQPCPGVTLEPCSNRASLRALADVEVPVGAVSDLRVLEESGRWLRLGWTGVPGATEYKVVVRNSQGERGRVSLWQGEQGRVQAAPSAPAGRRVLSACGCAPGRWHGEDEAHPRQPDGAGAG